MKNVLLILITILLFFNVSCLKTRQKVFHRKDFYNIQGIWDMKQCLIGGIDSTSRLKSACYFKYHIRYQGKSGSLGSPNNDNTLHLFNVADGTDFGSLNIENYKYKKVYIANANLNTLSSSSYICLCVTSLCNQSVIWNIAELTHEELIIEAVVNGKSYHVIYEKN